jgi:ammonium transporter Rh
MLSPKIRGTGKLSMVDVQNASLAGGVAIGSMCNMPISPAGALAVGFAAGAFCVFGYVCLTPLLERAIGLHDTCGVANLHGYVQCTWHDMT